MAKLNAAERKAMPKSEFGLPKTKDYPMPDRNHARLAKSGASHAERVGNISKATEEKIDRKADRVLGHGAGGAGGSKHASGMTGQKNIVHRSHHEKLRHG